MQRTTIVEPGRGVLALVTPSRRERQVLALLLRSCGNKQIAARLKLTEGTVKQYLNRMARELGLSSRLELAVWALSYPEIFCGHAAPAKLHLPGCTCARLYCTVMRNAAANLLEAA